MTTEPRGPQEPIVEADPAELHDFLDDSLACLRRLHRRHGRLVSFRKGDQRTLFAFGPDCNHLLFQKPDVYHWRSFVPGPRNSPQRKLGGGLFNMNGDKHRQHRRPIMPPIQKGSLDTYRAPLAELTDDLVDGWQVGRQYDLLAEVKSLSLRVTAKLLFGVEAFDLAGQIDKLFESWLELNHRVGFQATLPGMPDDDSYPRMLTAAAEMEQLIGELIARREALPPGPDVLSVLLQGKAHGCLGLTDVMADATHLFNAAYHTTSYALAWTLFLLAQHPDVLSRVYGELQDGPSPLLERSLRESMRLLPPVLYFARANVEPVQFGRHPLAAGTVFIGSHFVTHRLPDLYPQPERFRPDRWLTSNPGPFGYLPFGGGARMCAGAPFAQMMLQACLSGILRRYRVAVVPGARIDRKCSLTLGPRGGIPVTVQRHDGRAEVSPISGDIHELIEFPQPLRLPAAA